MSSWRTPSTSLVISSDIFGGDEDKEKIIKLLLDDTHHAESPVTVIPIVGMGGIGKTTLAQLVYSDVKVVENFDTRVWVCVAENSDPVHVTRTIIEAIDSRLCTMDNFDFLQTNLKEKLTGKTFLVVLDDVGHDQQDTWEDFLKHFRDGNNGSKILLTTRSGKVASVFAAPNRHYQLSLLSGADCWSVFLKHSSVSTNSERYATLEPIGRKIVEKCKGLPLAVKTLGGLLRNKYNVRDWENILESEIWELPQDESKIIPALRVSYHYLPSHLKRCFVYCSLFPEDLHFSKDELVLLWMDEGLLQPMENNTLENIGCAYFDELVARSFFQLSRGFFVMHDLMHDLATFFAGKFFFRVDGFGNPHMADSKTRHLSYKRDPISNFPEAYNGAIYMRTFLRVHVESNDIECDFWLKQLKCLRVLSFLRIEILSLPDSIGELIHLGYLDLSGTPIVTLPESLCKLYNLQTLKLEDCGKLEMLPSRMQDLVNLRHLDMRGADSLKEMPKGMSKLKLIIDRCEELACSLPRAPKLHQLTVDGSKSYSDARLHDVVIFDTKLAKYVVEWLPHIQSPCLQSLYIQECESAISISGDYLPDSLQFLSISYCSELTISEPLQHKSLTDICMERCDSLTMFPLGALPNLKTLSILECPEMDCFEEECLPPSLTTLRIRRCKKLERWITSKGLQSEGLTDLILEKWNEVKWFPREGCLPASLKSLELSYFSNLETLDCNGLHQLTSLQELTIEWCRKLGNITQQNLPASILKLVIKGECPLKSKLEEMNDPRIQFDTGWWFSAYSSDSDYESS